MNEEKDMKSENEALKEETPKEAILRFLKEQILRLCTEEGCNVKNISETKVNWDDWDKITVVWREKR
jgi:hypothetical protein